MSPRPLTPSPGDVLAGKYRVERVIGEGGMGVVVAATHLQLDQLVALKFTTLDSGPATARFLREAKSAVRLKSEHVARVTDVGTLENGAPYMVMEYLEGQDLNDLLRARGPLPIADAIGYVVQACEAVAEAHALGIVHRDLKPHNLFLTTSVSGLPKVKVLDFGISKTMTGDLALTRTAEIVGTPSYMSPEQLRSAKDVDLRTDIWALGVILYELLTGRLPFEAETLPQLCTMVATEVPPPPTVHRPDLPQPLADAVMRCLVRDAAARFVDAGELVAALAPFSPDWASAQSVRLVPSSSASGRAVISLMPGRASATSAAWSETELAPAGRKWPRLALGVTVATVAIGAALLLAFRMGARETSAPDSTRAAAASTATATQTPTATPTATSTPTPTPTPTATSTPLPAAGNAAPPASSEATTRPSPQSSARTRTRTPPPAVPAASTGTSRPPVDDPGAFERRK